MFANEVRDWIDFQRNGGAREDGDAELVVSVLRQDLNDDEDKDQEHGKAKWARHLAKSDSDGWQKRQVWLALISLLVSMATMVWRASSFDAGVDSRLNSIEHELARVETDR